MPVSYDAFPVDAGLAPAAGPQPSNDTVAGAAVPSAGDHKGIPVAVISGAAVAGFLVIGCE